MKYSSVYVTLVLFIKYILVFYESDNLALAKKQYNFREVSLVKYILLTIT